MSPHHSNVGHQNANNTIPTTNVHTSLHCWPPKHNQYNTNYQCPHISPLLATQNQPIQHKLPISPHHSTVGHPNPTITTPNTNVTRSLYCWPTQTKNYNTNYQCHYITPLLATQTQPIQHQLPMSPHHSTVGHPKPINTTPTTNVPISFHCWPPNPNQYNTNYQCPNITPLLANKTQPI